MAKEDDCRETHPGMRRQPYLIIAVAVLGLLAYPPLYSVSQVGLKAVFAFSCGDTFYYLVVAKNSVIGQFTFDTETLTNGFHPLWQYILTAAFSLMDRADAESQLYLTYFLSVLFTSTGFVFACWSVYAVTRSIGLSLWLIPGPFYLLFTATDTISYTYSPWAFMNGMESPLSLMFGGILLYLFSAAYARGPELDDPSVTEPADQRISGLTVPGVGIILSLLVLARLDDVFLVCSVAVFFLFYGGSWRSRFFQATAVVLPTVVLLALYLLSNWISGLPAMPVSGIIKASPTAAFSGNMATFLSDFLPPIHAVVRPEKYNLQHWIYTMARTSAMVLPVVFSAWLMVSIFRAWHGRRFESSDGIWIVPLLLYIFLKGSYNILNVRFWNQGYWYYPLCILMVNFIVVLLYWRMTRSSDAVRTRGFKVVCATLFGTIYLFHSAGVIFRAVSFEDWSYEVWKHRDELAAQVKEAGADVKLLDRSDAVFAYCLSLPAIALSGFTTDYQGYLARKNERFFEYCLERGYTVTYLVPSGWPQGWPLPQGFRYRPIASHASTGLTFVRVEPLPIRHRTTKAPKDQGNGKR